MNKPQTRPATVRDVALHAGVGMSTVSNALNHPERLAPETLERVQHSIASVGFVRNDSARLLRLGAGRMLGMILIDTANPFFATLSRSAEDRSAERNFYVLVGNAGTDDSREMRYIHLFESHRADGVIATPQDSDLTRWEELRDRGIPVVLADFPAPVDAFCSASVDHQLGGELVVRHLIEIGRRNLAFVTGPRTFPQIASRRFGAIAEAQRHPSTTVIDMLSRGFDIEAGREIGEQIASSGSSGRIDAVFAANDLLALGILESLLQNGIRVPHDIAIVGYDDDYFSSGAQVPLSTVRQPAAKIGSTTVELILAELEEGAGHKHVQSKFAPELIVRASSRPS